MTGLGRGQLELRVDGDAMAVWLSQGSIGRPPSNVPAWANAIGFVLVITVVFFAMVGSEVATIAAAESPDPARAVANMVATVVWRILLFYIGSVTLIVCIVPWSAVSSASRQKAPSSVIDTAQDRTYRLNQSITATR